MTEHIYIVEDEENIAKGIRLNLEAEGFRTEIIPNGKDAIARIIKKPPDLVLLDVMLPGASGFEVCDSVRQHGLRVPILFLTVRESEDDRVKGLELGGDDYMTKPFSVRELIQRIRAILRREQWYQQTATPDNLLLFGGNEVNFTAYKAITFRGEEISLTQKECMLMKLLVENEGNVIDRDTILDKVWGYDRYPSSRTIDNLILRLRKYFEVSPREPRYIHTIYGAGYRFTGDSTAA